MHDGGRGKGLAKPGQFGWTVFSCKSFGRILWGGFERCQGCVCVLLSIMVSMLIDERALSLTSLW